MNKEFKSAFERVKAYLGKSLTADNTDEITGLSNDLETMKIPKFLRTCIDDFEAFYLRNNEKKLIWCLGLSKLEIKYLCFPNKNVSVSTLPQFLTLLLLEKYNSLSIQKISELLECNIKILLADIPGLVYNPNFNPKGEKDKGLLLGTFNSETKIFKPR